MDLVLRELSLSQAIPTGVYSTPTDTSQRLTGACRRVICRIGNEGRVTPSSWAWARAKPNRCNRRPVVYSVTVTIMLIALDHRGESIIWTYNPRYSPVVRNAR